VTTLRPEIALIGAGLMGRWHAATARRIGARVIAVVDPDLARAGSLAARYGANAFPDLGRLLDGPRPQIAHVCSPLRSHAETCAVLLGAGCHVLCEKPLAPDAEAVTLLLDAADRHSRLLCPVHQFAWQRGVAGVIERLPQLGELRQVAFTLCSAGADAPSAPSRDDVLLDILPHPLSVLSRLLTTAPLAAIDWRVRRVASGEMQADGELAGTAISIFVSLAARPTEASAVVRGTRGTARLDFYHGYATQAGGGVSRTAKMLLPFATAASQAASAGSNLVKRAVTWEPAYPGLRTLVERFYAAATGAGPPPFERAAVLGVYRAADRLATAFRARA